MPDEGKRRKRRGKEKGGTDDGTDPKPRRKRKSRKAGGKEDCGDAAAACAVSCLASVLGLRAAEVWAAAAAAAAAAGASAAVCATAAGSPRHKQRRSASNDGDAPAKRRGRKTRDKGTDDGDRKKRARKRGKRRSASQDAAADGDDGGAAAADDAAAAAAADSDAEAVPDGAADAARQPAAASGSAPASEGAVTPAADGAQEDEPGGQSAVCPVAAPPEAADTAGEPGEGAPPTLDEGECGHAAEQTAAVAEVDPPSAAEQTAAPAVTQPQADTAPPPAGAESEDAAADPAPSDAAYTAEPSEATYTADAAPSDAADTAVPALSSTYTADAVPSEAVYSADAAPSEAAYTASDAADTAVPAADTTDGAAPRAAESPEKKLVAEPSDTDATGEAAGAAGAFPSDGPGAAPPAKLLATPCDAPICTSTAVAAELSLTDPDADPQAATETTWTEAGADDDARRPPVHPASKQAGPGAVPRPGSSGALSRMSSSLSGYSINDSDDEPRDAGRRSPPAQYTESSSSSDADDIAAMQAVAAELQRRQQEMVAAAAEDASPPRHVPAAAVTTALPESPEPSPAWAGAVGDAERAAGASASPPAARAAPEAQAEEGLAPAVRAAPRAERPALEASQSPPVASAAAGDHAAVAEGPGEAAEAAAAASAADGAAAGSIAEVTGEGAPAASTADGAHGEARAAGSEGTAAAQSAAGGDGAAAGPAAAAETAAPTAAAGVEGTAATPGPAGGGSGTAAPTAPECAQHTAPTPAGGGDTAGPDTAAETAAPAAAGVEGIAAARTTSPEPAGGGGGTAAAPTAAQHAAPAPAEYTAARPAGVAAAQTDAPAGGGGAEGTGRGPQRRTSAERPKPARAAAVLGDPLPTALVSLSAAVCVATARPSPTPPAVLHPLAAPIPPCSAAPAVAAALCIAAANTPQPSAAAAVAAALCAVADSSADDLAFTVLTAPVRMPPVTPTHAPQGSAAHAVRSRRKNRPASAGTTRTGRGTPGRLSKPSGPRLSVKRQSSRLSNAWASPGSLAPPPVPPPDGADAEPVSVWAFVESSISRDRSRQQQRSTREHSTAPSVVSSQPSEPQVARKLGNEDDGLERRKEHLEMLWDELNIPQAEREYFVEHFVTTTQAEPASLTEAQRNVRRKRFGTPEHHARRLLDKEIVTLQAHRARTLDVLRVIESREAAVAAVSAFAQRHAAAARFYRPSAAKWELRRLLQNVRSTSEAVVEALAKWRDGMAQPQPLVWNGMNYLTRMHNDLGFLMQTQLRCLLDVDVVNNPLLLPHKQNGSVPNPAAPALSRAELRQRAFWARLAAPKHTPPVDFEAEKFAAGGSANPSTLNEYYRTCLAEHLGSGDGPPPGRAAKGRRKRPTSSDASSQASVPERMQRVPSGRAKGTSGSPAPAGLTPMTADMFDSPLGATVNLMPMQFGGATPGEAALGNSMRSSKPMQQVQRPHRRNYRINRKSLWDAQEDFFGDGPESPASTRAPAAENASRMEELLAGQGGRQSRAATIRGSVFPATADQLIGGLLAEDAEAEGMHTAGGFRCTLTNSRVRFLWQFVYVIFLMWRGMRKLLRRARERKAAVRIQCFFRRSVANRIIRQLKRERAAALMIQKWMRGVIMRKRFAHNYTRHLAARAVQCVWRRRMAVKATRRRFEQRAAAIRLQRLYRGFRARRAYGQLKRRIAASTTIQSAWRVCSAKAEVAWRKGRLGAVMVLQRCWRCAAAKTRLALLRLRHRSATIIQRNWRGYNGRLYAFRVLLERNAAVTIQCAWRVGKSKECVARVRLEHRSAVLIQKCYRMHVAVCRSARLSESRAKWLEQFLRKAQNNENARAAIVIQTTWRLWRASHVIDLLLERVARNVAEHVLREKESCALTIQCAVRQWIARRVRRELWSLLINVKRCQALSRVAIHTRRARRRVAARRIQRCWRFYAARKRAKAERQGKAAARAAREAESDVADSAALLQATWRGFLTRRWAVPLVRRRRRALEDRVLAEMCIDAATCIQSAYRRRLAVRLQMRLVRARNYSAAARIQAVWKGRSERRYITDYVINSNRTRTAAALRLQTFWRCYVEAQVALEVRRDAMLNSGA
eukprot:TRINITY_DN2648_c0_g1_i1.p1 TRINITY_DN2648_c0_g1~~TRINITY_DN2648_c0_g1_i1.p1  ORF type:complete len:2106 (+),score=649.03 TRINITY_DN2648_c0_g1_i1:59-6319(+)